MVTKAHKRSLLKLCASLYRSVYIKKKLYWSPCCLKGQLQVVTIGSRLGKEERNGVWRCPSEEEADFDRYAGRVRKSGHWLSRSLLFVSLPGLEVPKGSLFLLQHLAQWGRLAKIFFFPFYSWEEMMRYSRRKRILLVTWSETWAPLLMTTVDWGEGVLNAVVHKKWPTDCEPRMVSVFLNSWKYKRRSML